MSSYTLLVAGFFFILWLIFSYVKFSSLTSKINKTWLQCQPLLRQRYQLFPILINMVKNQAGYPQEKLQFLQFAYNQAIDPRSSLQILADLDRQCTELIIELLIFLQNFSELKVNPEFINLENYIVNIESQLNALKSAHNALVEEFNSSISTTPNNIIGKVMQLQIKNQLPLASL